MIIAFYSSYYTLIKIVYLPRIVCLLSVYRDKYGSAARVIPGFAALIYRYGRLLRGVKSSV